MELFLLHIRSTKQQLQLNLHKIQPLSINNCAGFISIVDKTFLSEQIPKPIPLLFKEIDFQFDSVFPFINQDFHNFIA